MILWGNIREFPLFTIVQFLASQRRSGILDIQDFEDMGVIYLTDGRIDAISLPLSDELLGARLVSVGAITESRVKECWMTCSEDLAGPPIAAALLDVAKAEREVLVEIANRHTADQIMQLMYWHSGTFRFTVPETPIRFSIVPSLNVENLLLEAYRRIDEGERPPREKLLDEEELCATCTLECTPDIKARYLKQDVCLWRNMPSVLREPVFRTLGALVRLEEDDTDELSFI